jgi:hypothetical protein
MRNLVSGRLAPQPTAQVTAKPLESDLGTAAAEPEMALGPETGADKQRAVDSRSQQMFEPAAVEATGCWC